MDHRSLDPFCLQTGCAGQRRRAGERSKRGASAMSIIALLLLCAGCQPKPIEKVVLKRVPNPVDPRVELVVRDSSIGTSLVKEISAEFGTQRKVVCVISGANSDGRRIDIRWKSGQIGSVNLVGYKVWEVTNRVGYFNGAALAQNEEVYVDFTIASQPEKTRVGP